MTIMRYAVIMMDIGPGSDIKRARMIALHLICNLTCTAALRFIMSPELIFGATDATGGYIKFLVSRQSCEMSRI